MKRSSPLAFLALTGLLLTACGGTTPGDVTAPTIKLTAAPKTVTAAGAVTLTADANDNVGVTKVTFYRGDTEIGSDTTAPYEFKDNVTAAQNGSVVYRAVATDAAGNTADAADTVTINISTAPPADTTKPTVTLTAAPKSVTAAGAVTLTADATDDVGVVKVTFYRGDTEIGSDTTAPYEFKDNVTAAQNGSVIYRAVATDAAGNFGESTTTVTVNIGNTPADTTKPTVKLAAAPKTVTFTGTVTLSAEASDDVGVTKVSFYKGATLISEDTTAPYTATATVGPADGGTVTFRAVASDAAGNTAESTDTVSVVTGTGLIQGIVVDQNIGAPVAGSTITVMSGGQTFSTLTSGADGTFNLDKLPAGTYDLQARKAGLAGFDLHGLVVGDGAVKVRVIQPPAFETSASTDGAKLVLTRADGQTPLAGTTFTDTVDFKITAAADSNHIGPVRVMYAQLGRTPGSSSVAGSSQDGKWFFTPQQDLLTPPTSGAVTLPNAGTPNFIKGFGSAAGEAVNLEVLVVDFNYNYSLYIVPITLKNTAKETGTTVTAPKNAAAVAYTLKQEGSWTQPYALPGADATAPVVNAAPNGSGVFVELRWCNADAAPFAFDIERSADGTTFSKIGTVAGGTSASCPANQLSRPFYYRDNSADLSVGKTFTYRVVARGANTATSNTTQTTPLAPFMPKLLAPGDETTGVSLTPTFVIGHPQLEIGADGAAYNLQLRDLYNLSGYNLPGNPAAANTLGMFRVEEGTGDTGNGVPAGQTLVYTSGLRSNYLLTDTAGISDATKPNLAPVDTAKHTVSLPLELFANPLQPLRPHKWQMYAGYAYKYLPSEGQRVSAYSVYAWPSSATQPIPATRPQNQNFDFITGQK
ncbi:carboxypeptidase regulatory-like domain-containing protein [Deinococcus sp. D7000]|nr:carboxypeptidase regulatory-like domain-containing protein [Deinococcus sp. D7000]